jgi:cytochrome c oxidase subunit 2
MHKLLREGAAVLAGLALAASVAAAEAGAGAAAKIQNPAAGWDHLWREVIIDITVIGIIFALVTAWFIFRYRARAPGEEGSGPKLSAAAAVAWVVIPTFVFLADDFFVAANGWALWNVYRDVPADRMEIKLESGMYSWDYTYPNGVRSQNELRVPAGKPIMLRMTSRDTLHSHWIPDFRVKEDSMPGRVTYLWFYPEKPGQHVVTCAAYCGVMHSYMAGQIIVLPPAEFQAWLDQETTKLAASTKAAEPPAPASKPAKGASKV